MINALKIHLFFKDFAKYIIKLRYLILIAFLFIVGVSFTGLSKITTDSGWDKWVLENSPMKIGEDEFKEIFGNNDYVAVMVETENIFTPEILQKIRELGNELKRNVPFADDIMSVTDCEFSIATDDGIKIVNLVPKQIPKSSAELEQIRKMALSKDLIADKLISKNSKESWIILRLHPFPEGWRDNNNEAADYAVGKKANEIIYQDKYKILNPKPAGMPVLTKDKTDFFKKEMKRTMLLSMFASAIVLTLALRSLKGVVISLACAFFSIIILFGIQGHFGDPVDTSILLVPVYLGVAVSIAYSIHVFTFFNRDFRKTGKRKEAVVHAMEETAWPIFFTALTTAAALVSFILIDIKPLKWVGTAATSMVFIILSIVVFVIPSILAIGSDKKKTQLVRRKTDIKIENFLGNFSEFVLKNKTPIMIIFILTMGFLFAGLSKFQVSFDLEKTMGRKVAYVDRLCHVNETEVGSLYSYNMVINFPKPGMAKDPKNLKNFDLLLKKAQSQKYTKRVSSIVEIIKDMNCVLNNGNREFYSIPATKEMTAQIMLLYENAGGKEAEKWVDYEYQRLRLMIELSDYNAAEVKKEIVELENYASRLFPAADVEIAGTVALFTFMQDIVAYGQIKSFIIAALLITVMMIFVTGSLKTGLISMIPNIFPSLAVGGLMGWLDIPLDIFTITIMPMLLGLAVDDTIHFISHSKFEFEKDPHYKRSIINTFKTTGVPLFFTSVIITANFMVYATSPANVYFHLGILTSFGIMTALASDFFVTPILIDIFKPFGKQTKEKSAYTTGVLNEQN